ncbi:MAG: DUF2165 domain-containing protein, partial [Burkholderiales bacterium]|nr:DUF2165 domain-containing protein [Opitutaceae bacterium]
AASAFFFLIVVLNNAVLDYPSNYQFVNHVLAMDSLFSGEAQRWRAIPDPTPADGTFWFHHLFYWTIIAWEAAAGVLCAAGAWKLWKKLKAPAASSAPVASSRRPSRPTQRSAPDPTIISLKTPCRPAKPGLSPADRLSPCLPPESSRSPFSPPRRFSSSSSSSTTPSSTTRPTTSS